MITILRDMCSIGTTGMQEVQMTWQRFEDLFVQMEVVREILLSRTLQEDKSILSIISIVSMQSLHR